MQERTVTIVNRLGLHARAAARLVQCASQFTSRVEIRHCENDKKADGKSILSVLLLAAVNGTTLQVQTEGEDEERAANAIMKLIEQRFGEEVSDAVY